MKITIYVVVFLLLMKGFTANKGANSLIKDSCKKVAEYKPSYYEFCIASIEENPESQKARNIIELTVVAVKNARSNMTNTKGIVDKILKERKYKNKTSEKIFRDCSDWYVEGIDSLTKALHDLKLRDDKKVFESISDARDAPKSCESIFNTRKQTSPMTKLNNVLYEMVDIPQLLMLTMPI